MRCDSDGEGIFGWMEYFGWRYGWNLSVVVQTVLGSVLRCQHLGGDGERRVEMVEGNVG